MAIQIQAVITTKGRESLAKSFGGALGSYSWSYAAYFKVGTSGFQDVQNARIPQVPDPSLLDIQSPGEGSFWYKRSFIDSDVLFVAPSGIQFRCFLDLTQGNGDANAETDTPIASDGPKNTSSLAGESPKLFEIGIFDAQHNMIAYGTFPEETKLASKTLNHLVTLNF